MLFTRNRILATAAVVLGALLSTSAGGAPATAGGVIGTPGSPGAGDPYFPTYGNGGYDVQHYEVHADYRPSSGMLHGDTTVTVKATQDLSRFNLDLTVPATSVQVDGVDAVFTQDDHELVVDPASDIANGATFTVRVLYAGNPGDLVGGTLGGWFVTADGAIAAGEPEVSVFWYPANDHPSDKATFDLYLTGPESKQIVSNGLLKSRKTAAGRTTWHWQVNQPMTTYLATADIGDYVIKRGTTPAGTPYLYGITEHMSGALRRDALRSLQLTPAVTDFFSKKFGPYPFDATGGILANATFGFSLENQTRPNYSKVFFSGGSNSDVIAHELSHMWWGDSVSVSQWNDIWINEGFATWSEWLFEERRTHGRASLNEIFRAYYDGLKGFDPLWKIKVSDPGSDSVFDYAVYARGGMALQALRNKIGATDHAKLLRTWARTHRYGNATLEQFEALAESISGKNLDTFFSEWLDQTNRPLPSRALGFPRSMLKAKAAGAARPDPLVTAFIAQQKRNVELGMH